MRKILLLLILLLLVVTWIQLEMTQGRTEQKQNLQPAKIEGSAAIGGPFSLTDQNGRRVTDADFRGKLMLVYFGFTRCPDMCPLTTSNLSATLDALGDKGNEVTPLFISVDPENDTPEVLEEYLAEFDPRIVGLTGTLDEVTQATKAYKTYFAKSALSDEEAQAAGSEYTVDHSGYIFLMGRDGSYIRLLPYDTAPAELAAAVKTAL